MKTWKKRILYPAIGITGFLGTIGILGNLIKPRCEITEKSLEYKRIYINQFKSFNSNEWYPFNLNYSENLEKNAREKYSKGKGKGKTTLWYFLPYTFEKEEKTLKVLGNDTLINNSKKTNYLLLAPNTLTYYFEGYKSPREILKEIEEGKKAYEHGFWGSGGKLEKTDSILLRNLKKDLKSMVENPDSLKIDITKKIDIPGYIHKNLN